MKFVVIFLRMVVLGVQKNAVPTALRRRAHLNELHLLVSFNSF